MADTTEKKTYLIDIESNLKKYAEDAAAAKKEVDALTASTAALKKSGQENTAEYQLQSAQLKVAKQNYTDLQKVVAAGVQLTNKELSYRQQLTAAIKITVQNIKDLSKQYTVNADGIKVINPLIIKEEQLLKGLNMELQTHDKSLSSGSTSVGLYGQAIEGAFKDAGSKIMGMVGPMALVGAAIGVATKLWEGMKEAIMSTTFGIDTMNKSIAISKQLFYDLAINGKSSLETLIQASKIQGELNVLRIKDGIEALQISKINREEQAIREISIDRTKTDAERLAALIKVKELESEKTKIQIGNLTDELKAKEKLLLIQPANEKLLLNIIALRTQINDTYAAEDQAMRRVTGQLTAFEQEKIDARKKGYDAWMAEIDAANKASDDVTKRQNDVDKKRQDERKKQEIIAEQEAEKFINAELARMDKEAEAKWNKEVEFQRQLFEFNRKAGQDEYDARIAQAEALAEAELAIQQTLLDSKINLASAFSNFLGAIAGKNKGLQNAALVAEKALAIAEVVINTTKANAAIRATAAMSVLPGPAYLPRLAANMAAAMVPINLNRVAAALDIAAIIAATASQIKSNNSAASGGASSAPTAISSSQPAQRTFAQAQGSSVLTQAQLSQPQLNAIPNQNMLTAADIANALKGLPAPVVTVEDINVKVKSMNKVAVRANI
jgi:hypothetical protein